MEVVPAGVAMLLTRLQASRVQVVVWDNWSVTVSRWPRPSKVAATWFELASTTSVQFPSESYVMLVSWERESVIVSGSPWLVQVVETECERASVTYVGLSL